MLRKIKTILLSLGVCAFVLLQVPPSANAAPCTTPGVNGCVCSSQGCDDGQADTNPCHDSKLSADQQQSCADCNTGQTNDAAIQKCLSNNRIVRRLQGIVNFLSALVGVVVVAGIIVGGIQYSMAGDSPEAVGKAKKRITNALIALLFYIFLFALVQWLIPGSFLG